MKNIIFYGAGKNAINIYGSGNSQLRSAFPNFNHGICFVDADKSRHGTVYMGLPVKSLDEALDQYPEAKIYVTLGEAKKYEVFHDLVSEKR